MTADRRPPEPTLSDSASDTVGRHCTDAEIVDLIRRRLATIRDLYGLHEGPMLAPPRAITPATLWDLLLGLDPDEIEPLDRERAARPAWPWLRPSKPA